MQQLCLDRHLPDIASNIEDWGALHDHNIKINALFEEKFKARELIHYKQQQYEFLKFWKNIAQNNATYCKLCENFRSTQNTKAETFTKHLSVSSLKGNKIRPGKVELQMHVGGLFFLFALALMVVTKIINLMYQPNTEPTLQS